MSKKRYKFNLTEKQIEAITTCLFEYSCIIESECDDYETSSYYDDVRKSMYRQLENQTRGGEDEQGKQ